MILRLTILSCFLALFGTPSVRANDNRIRDFFATVGCAIGPATIEAAHASGIDQLAVQAFADTMRADPRTLKTGDWLVLAPENCKIVPPSVTSQIRMSDPEVMQNLSAIDAHAKDGDFGCYLAGQDLVEAVRVSRKWSFDKANLEYLRFLSASIISGELSFYSPDPLRTPPGFVATHGACAGIPQLPAIRRSHSLLMIHFDALIRADAAVADRCQDGGGPSWQFPEIVERIAGERAANAWIGFEARIVFMGAGWYEGVTSSSKGSPRPPLCRYEPAQERAK